VGSGFKTFTAGSVLTASDVQNYLQDQAVMVFGGTAARSSAIGTANFEEGMLTYLTDVDKLQVYTGSSFQDVYPPAATSQGMTLINTTSFSAVASQSLLANTFSSTYKFYRIVIAGSASADTGFNGRLRASGSDITATNYSHTGVFTNNAAGPSRSNATGVGNWEIGTLGTNGFHTELTLSYPFDTGFKKTFISHSFANYASDRDNRINGGQYNATTQTDSFTFYPTSGTITGEVTVYGFNR
jgi:hypothetical protein